MPYVKQNKNRTPTPEISHRTGNHLYLPAKILIKKLIHFSKETSPISPWIVNANHRQSFIALAREALSGVITRPVCHVISRS